MSELKVLDLGCGERKTPGAVGMDRVKLPGVDIVHDLDHYPFPIEENSYDRIVLRHVAEHVTDVVGLMDEVYRISRNGALIDIYTPHYTSPNAYNDPTHKHQFSLTTFDFFCGATVHGYVVKSRFNLVKREVSFWELHDKIPFVPFHWLGIRWLATRHTIFYERFVAFLFPIKEFHVTLEVLK